MIEPILSFRGPYMFLSNFFLCEVVYAKMWFPTVEHAFQAAKSNQPIIRAKMKAAPSAWHAKRWGQTIDLRSDWELVKVRVMAGLLEQKFRVGTRNHESLIKTGTVEIIEGNDWRDHFWGMVRGPGPYTDPGMYRYNNEDGTYWYGRNWLGKLLMAQRDEGHMRTVVEEYALYYRLETERGKHR